MLSEICAFLRNWFDRKRIFGSFIVSGGRLYFADGSALPLLTDQYFRICGSVFNDGVHQYPATDLKDESFDGAVWAMACPPDFLALAVEIKDWCSANAEAIATPYQSESFAGYSYSMKSGGNASGDDGIGWQTQFAARLAPWRKI